MIQGQCLCGAVKYRYAADLECSIICFCQHCRLAQGAVFGWNSPIDESKFQLIQGLSSLKEYFHTPNKARVFCSQCGSPLYSYRTDLPNVLRLRLGTVTQGDLPAPKEGGFQHYQPDFICINSF
ncbi:GFA family protein [Acinetobacter pragensis]|uniref:GFA family protein n=1 Tax=Acinetobacter pragensis TaxID=1806892 RepID=UPI003340C00A